MLIKEYLLEFIPQYPSVSSLFPSLSLSSYFKASVFLQRHFFYLFCLISFIHCLSVAQSSVPHCAEFFTLQHCVDLSLTRLALQSCIWGYRASFDFISYCCLLNIGLSYLPSAYKWQRIIIINNKAPVESCASFVLNVFFMQVQFKDTKFHYIVWLMMAIYYIIKSSIHRISPLGLLW